MRLAAIVALFLLTTQAQAGIWLETEWGPVWVVDPETDTPKRAFMKAWNERPAAERGNVVATDNNVRVTEFSLTCINRYVVTFIDPPLSIPRYGHFTYNTWSC